MRDIPAYKPDAQPTRWNRVPPNPYDNVMFVPNGEKLHPLCPSDPVIPTVPCPSTNIPPPKPLTPCNRKP